VKNIFSSLSLHSQDLSRPLPYLFRVLHQHSYPRAAAVLHSVLASLNAPEFLVYLIIHPFKCYQIKKALTFKPYKHFQGMYISHFAG
jgi:hypothetical protein